MPAIRAMFVLYPLSLIPYFLSLALLVFGGFADHSHHTLAVNDLALIANFLY
jgi:hypothetical protein